MKSDKTTVIWAGAVVVATAGFLLLVTRPQVGRLRGLADQSRSAQAAQAMSRHDLRAIEELQQEVEELTARAANFDAQIPRHKTAAPFLGDLARFAEARKLRLARIEPGEPVRSAEIVALPIALRVRGPFPVVYGLIQDIERMTRLTRIDRFETEADDENSGSVSASVSLRIFFRAS